jgi:hypothetical protein
VLLGQNRSLYSLRQAGCQRDLLGLPFGVRPTS